MSVYRRKSGRWAVIVDLERDAAGHRRRRNFGTYRTRKEAERAERDALAARDRGTDIDPERVTVKQLVDRYVRERQALGREAKTLQEYDGHIDRYIKPHLGSIPLAKLRPAHVADWVAMLLERGGHEGHALSPKTSRHAFALMNATLRWGVRMQLVQRNVCEAVTPPSVPRSEAKALSAEEVSRLFAVAKGTRWEAFITLAFALGMRRGELCALSWRDVDLDGATVRIHRSLSQTRRGGVCLKPTKTNNVRTLPLSSLVLKVLRAQSAAQAQDKLKAASAYGDEGAVFADRLGRRITPMAATNAYARLARTARLSSTRLHDARHTAATALLVGGVDVRTTAGVLGHANPTITLSTYAHLLPDAQRDALDRLGEHVARIAETRQNALGGTEHGYQRATTAPPTLKKARVHEVGLVAPTGVEPVGSIYVGRCSSVKRPSHWTLDPR